MTRVFRKAMFNCLDLLVSVTCVFVIILSAYTTFAKFAVFILLLKF